MDDLILLDRHEVKLRALLQNAAGVEAAAYMTFGRAHIAADPWTEEPRTRFISHQVSAVPDEDLVSASSVHVTWSTRGFVKALARASAVSLCLGIVHTHPLGTAVFSDQDDRNEAGLAASVRNRNGPDFPFLSVLFGGDGTLAARVWRNGAVSPVQRITIAGRRLRFFGHLGNDPMVDEAFERQGRLFGEEVNARLRDLRVAVVGAGGTGSPVVALLLRLGVGKLLLIDKDIVEVTNLNRVHGARLSDAGEGLAKVEVLAREIRLADLGADVQTRRAWAGAPDVREALRACDVIFGCTDDHDGRALLSRMSYFYGVPLIDVGLRIVRREPNFDMVARTSFVTPGGACLLCRGVVDPRRAAEEALERDNPEDYRKRKAEAYVVGGGDPAPAVVTFTTEAATMAVNELLQSLTDYRGAGGAAWGRFRTFQTLEDRVVTIPPKSGCRVCDGQNYWGLGDVEPFTYRVG